MKRMIIQGGNRLSGEVTIGGAKNSTVALIPAAILADTPVEFDTVPDILDVHNLMIILESMNVKSSFTHGFFEIDPTQIIEAELPSFLLLYGCSFGTLPSGNTDIPGWR